MKRIFELLSGDIRTMTRDRLLATVRHSEGRTLMVETVVAGPPLIYSGSNVELAAAFGADMITLNCFDCQRPFIAGWDELVNDDPYDGRAADFVGELQEKFAANLDDPGYIARLRQYCGRLIGLNLEPVAGDLPFPDGRRLSAANLDKVNFWQFDYVVITANPNTGVTAGAICRGIELAKAKLGERTAVVAGKMHGAGSGNVYDPRTVRDFVTAGADIVLIPAPGTVPGIDLDVAKRQIDAIHAAGGLAMAATGTSQEGAGVTTVEQIALWSKMAGADIMHVGDAGFAGIAPPENIIAVSVVIRGKRHTYARIGRSVLR
ncbi:MAG: hypothetical protein N3A57_02735 [Negativicutes bacterium]|nr:hypothetical protein [Negativicutes bacterium]